MNDIDCNELKKPVCKEEMEYLGVVNIDQRQLAYQKVISVLEKELDILDGPHLILLYYPSGKRELRVKSRLIAEEVCKENGEYEWILKNMKT